MYVSTVSSVQTYDVRRTDARDIGTVRIWCPAEIRSCVAQPRAERYGTLVSAGGWRRRGRADSTEGIRKRCRVSTCMLQMPTCMLHSKKSSVYLSPQKQEHHRHPTVPTHETRQIPTHNTLVCASCTNNTYTFHALPRKILCQAGTSPKSHCPPAPAW